MMIMRPDIRVILVLVFMAGCAAPTAQRTTAAPASAPATTGPPVLPELARKAIDEKYKQWDLARVVPAGSCQDRLGPSPNLISGDFNDDGFTDYGAWIATSGGVRLIALMGWLSDYQVYELETLPDTTAPRFLGLEKRGTKFSNPKTKLEDYFSQNTLTTYSCGKDRIVYLWVGFHFEREVLPD